MMRPNDLHQAFWPTVTERDEVLATLQTATDPARIVRGHAAYNGLPILPDRDRVIGSPGRPRWEHGKGFVRPTRHLESALIIVRDHVSNLRVDDHWSDVYRRAWATVQPLQIPLARALMLLERRDDWVNRNILGNEIAEAEIARIDARIFHAYKIGFSS